MRSAGVLKKCVWSFVALGACCELASIGVVVTSAVKAVPVKSDVAVVLGNKVNLDGSPAPRLRARLDEGLRLYRAGEVKQVIVSGGVEKNGLSEPQIMEDYLRKHGVPENAITMDATGRTTHLTAVALSRMLAHDTSVIAVSQWFHLARSELALRQCGFTAVSGAAPRYFELHDGYSVIRESFGLPFYYLFHKTCG